MITGSIEVPTVFWHLCGVIAADAVLGICIDLLVGGDSDD